jgi:hypothetical protein
MSTSVHSPQLSKPEPSPSLPAPAAAGSKRLAAPRQDDGQMIQRIAERAMQPAPARAAVDTGYGDLVSMAQRRPGEHVQRAGASPAEDDPARVHEAARMGTQGGAGALPHLDAIQRSFGNHDVSSVMAHTDTAAASGAQAMGASAFTMGEHVAFAGTPSLHTAAHEAAHVVQQRGGVSLPGGVGAVGDRYEQHADAVADAVVAGRSAEDMLGTF